MATFDYTLTDQDVGRVLPIADGYLVALSMTTPPLVHEVLDYDPATQQFTSGYFTLKGEGDLRNLINVQPATTAGAFSWIGNVAHMAINSSIQYRGELVIVGVPRGSTWRLTVSDVENVRAPPPPTGAPLGDYPTYRHSRALPLERERELEPESNT